MMHIRKPQNRSLAVHSDQSFGPGTRRDELNVVNFQSRAKHLDAPLTTATLSRYGACDNGVKAPVTTNTRESSRPLVALATKPEEYARKPRTRRMQAGVSR